MSSGAAGAMSAEACWRAGEAARTGGRLQDAVLAYRRLLAFEPSFMPAWANFALMLQALPQAAGLALVQLGRARAIEPGHAQLAFNWGNALAALEPGRAARAYRLALALDPGMGGAWLNLGVGLQREGVLAGAARAALRAASLGGGAGAMAAALNNLANVRRDQGLIGPALALYDRALAHDPRHADAARNRLAARLYVDDDDEAAAAAAAAFMRAHGAGQPLPPVNGDRDPERRLRVGLLSSDLGDHPVGRNLAGFVAHRDRAQLFLAAYDCGGRRDPASAWFRGRVDLWREVAALDDAAIAGVVRADAIDVLVVVAGRFDRNRPLVATWRPAPLQVAIYDGGPSGVGEGRGGAGEDPAIAGWISDRFLHPEGERCGGDRLVRLPVSYCFLAPERPPVPHRPADGGLRLGSFSNPAKLSPACLAAWARILADLPEARLVLKYRAAYGDGEVRARIAAALPAGRLDFVAAPEDAQAHLERYGAIDLALDPFPFSGATTSFEALAQGVPVLTLAGRSAMARNTTAILGPLGLDELIATSVDDYVGRAVALARDRERLAALRAEIPRRLAGSSLLDGPAHAAALAGALRGLWRERIGNQKSEGQKPEGV
jgi:protein O-GlcNAc transferase